MKNIHSHTETVDHPYPGYITVTQEQGRYFINVRTRGGAIRANVELEAHQLQALADDITAELKITPPSDVKAAKAKPAAASTAAPVDRLDV